MYCLYHSPSKKYPKLIYRRSGITEKRKKYVVRSTFQDRKNEIHKHFLQIKNNFICSRIVSVMLWHYVYLLVLPAWWTEAYLWRIAGLLGTGILFDLCERGQVGGALHQNWCVTVNLDWMDLYLETSLHGIGTSTLSLLSYSYFFVVTLNINLIVWWKV